eukprot:g2826.t1
MPWYDEAKCVFPLGVAVGLGIGYLFNRQQNIANNNPGIHVLKVDLEFENSKERNIFCKNFKSLAEKVYANEPNCYSYKVMLNCDNESKLSIYERYKTKAYLDGIHQETLKANRESKEPKIAGGRAISKVLTHYTETDIGHMSR